MLDPATGDPKWSVEFKAEVCNPDTPHDLITGDFKVRFSPDGRWLVAECQGKISLVLEVATGREVIRLESVDLSTIVDVSVHFSPDGRWLAARSLPEGRTLRILEVATGREVSRVEFEGASVSFSPDSRLLARSNSDGTVIVMRAATGEESLRVSTDLGELHTVQFSPDGLSLAVAGKGGAAMVDVISSTKTWQVSDKDIPSISFSPDGKWLAWPDDSQVHMVEADTGHEVWPPKDRGSSNHVEFSPDGKWLVTGNKVLDAATGSPWPGHDGSAGISPTGLVYDGAVSFSPDGRWSWATGGDYKTLRVSDTETHNRYCIDLDAEVVSVSFSPDGRWLAVGSLRGMLLLKETAVNNEIDHISEASSDTFKHELSRDGRWRVDETKGGLRMIDAASGKEVWKLTSQHNAMNVCFSPDGQRVAAAIDETLRMIDTATGKEAWRLELGWEVYSMSFSPDERWVAASAWGTNFSMINASTGKNAWELTSQHNGVTVCFSPDGQRVAAAIDETLRMIDTATGKEAWRLELGWPVESVSFSSDKRWVAASGGGTHFSMINASTGKNAWQLTSQHYDVSARFSPDGQRVAAAIDESLRMIDTATGDELWRSEFDEWLYSLSFSPNSRWLAGRTKHDMRVMESSGGNEIVAGKTFGFLDVKFDPVGRWFENEHGIDGLVTYDTSWWTCLEKDPAFAINLLRMQSFKSFDACGHFVNLSRSELRAATEAARNSDGPNRVIARWLFAEPVTRSFSPWDETPMFKVIGERLIGSSDNYPDVKLSVDRAPWHPLAPVSLARAGNEGQQRREFLSNLTLKRLRDADESIYGKDTLVSYCAHSSAWMLDLGQCEAALQTAEEGLRRDPASADCLKAKNAALAKSPTVVELRTARDVAVWAIGKGGKVGFAGGTSLVGSVDQLPPGDDLPLEQLMVSPDSGSEPVPARQLSVLPKLPNLRVLDLRANPIGDDGIRRLSGLADLTTLNVHACNLTDAAMPEVAKLTKLENLDVGFSHGGITDKGAAFLSQLPALKTLNIYDSGITDRTLTDVLSKLPVLEQVELTDTKVTEAGIAAFRELKPACRIIRSR